MSRAIGWATRTVACLGLAGLLAVPAAAARLKTVQVEAAVELGENRSGARDRAFKKAVVEAVVEVALSLLDRPLVDEEVDELRTSLADSATAAVLSYRIERGAGPRPVPGARGREEYALGLTATVDSDYVRALLERVGWLAARSERPSVVFVTREAPDSAPVPQALLESFEGRLEDRLRDGGFIVVEPALRAGGDAGSAVERARALGSDVAIDVVITWRPQAIGQAAGGGSVEVRLQALRTRDGVELASSRFGAPAYHSRADEAKALALESVTPQVAENLASQLEQNWGELAKGNEPVELVLRDVSGLAQVDEVRDVLVESLGATEAELARLGPRSAALRVRGELSPGALQDRLAGIAFDGFRLEPRTVGVAEVELRVVGTGAGSAPAASP